MTADDKKNEEIKAEVAEPPARTESKWARKSGDTSKADADEGADTESPDGVAADAADEMADREAEIAELKGRILHTLADMENLRRRTEREVADARKYAVSNFAREMLTIGDNLQRALDAVPATLRDGDDKAATALIEGVEVTSRSLEQTLQKFGVARIEAKGQKFDPAMHQAMMEVDDPTAEPGTVADEIQTGYAIGDRVLRPSFVSVVKKSRFVRETAAGKPAAGKSAPAGSATSEDRGAADAKPEPEGDQ